MEPTVGRIVHFYPSEEEPEPRAAIITYVHSPTMVNLEAFAQDGADKEGGQHTSVEQKSEQMTRYCWDWPPRK